MRRVAVRAGRTRGGDGQIVRLVADSRHHARPPDGECGGVTTDSDQALPVLGGERSPGSSLAPTLWPTGTDRTGRCFAAWNPYGVVVLGRAARFGEPVEHHETALVRGDGFDRAAAGEAAPFGATR